MEADPSTWGIEPGHHHVRGDWVPAPDLGVDAALRAMGATGSGPGAPSTWVIRPADGVHVPWPATLVLEDGSSRRAEGWVGDLPLGYHRLAGAEGQDIRLIVSPGVCPRPRRGWGWVAQLYATRSRASWGIGDLGDLASLCSWSAGLGASMVMINPLHAGSQASPYFPSSRRWRNPIYLHVPAVPGAALVPLDDLDAAGRALDGDRRIDRAAVWELKRAALLRIWEAVRAGPLPELDTWAAAQGASLQGFATWSALADEHGPDWRTWPERYRRPSDPAVASFAGDHADELRFHAWLQWLLDIQLVPAGRGVSVVTDLAIGADPAGADAWQWQDVLAAGVTVGAPPDEFSPGGQDWGLPPFDPWRLRAAGYQPFIEIVRAALAGGGGMRIDHVAGLFRLFWVPAGATASDGVYVRYPSQDLLNVVALEAARAGAFVIGEDLGTVEPSARSALAEAGILSYRLVWFEEHPPEAWPALALGAVTTHDLPTVSGVWTGADQAARREVGLPVDEEADAGLRRRLQQVGGCEDGLAVGEVVRRTYAVLASSPCDLVAATLEDALELDERPNQPGTTDEWPNWSIALPLPLEDVETDPRVREVGEILGAGRS